MSEIKNTINEQLQQLQNLMHRVTFHNFMGEGKMFKSNRGQGRVLAMLKMKPEISQRDLTYLLGMSKQSLAELLTKLEKSGYITRKPSEEDRRVMNISLTEEGAKVADRDIDDTGSGMTKVLDCLNDEELENFSDYLEKIIKQLEEQFPGEDFDNHRKMMKKFMMEHGREFKKFAGHGDHHKMDRRSFMEAFRKGKHKHDEE